jgi:purine nucleoside permease
MKLRAPLLILLACSQRLAGDEPRQQGAIPVKVVVVATFEIGADTGDVPGEFQFWAEGEKLDKVYLFPNGYHDLKMNSRGVLGCVTGCGKAQAAASIMALGLDPRFDLSKAYWILSGIAGANPEVASIGSVAWARWVVDCDLAHEVDAREMPSGWSTGFFPLGAAKPYTQAPKLAEEQNARQFYRIAALNPHLAEWAYGLTRRVKLEDSDIMASIRGTFAGFPVAQRPPFVLKGDVASTDVFWHGTLLSQRIAQWITFMTGGKGTYAMSAMEDIGELRSLSWLSRSGRVDFNRVMVLRGGSNYDSPPPGVDAAADLNREFHNYSGYVPSLENIYRCGSVVADRLADNWAVYSAQIPGGE